MAIEIKTTSSKDYYIRAVWEGRAETPEQLAARFLRTIDSLKEIDPVFNLWTCGKRRPRKFEEVRNRYAEEIAAGVTRDDWRKACPDEGYWFGALTRDVPKNRSFALSGKGGSILRDPFTNSMMLETSAPFRQAPDPDVLTHQIFHSALLAIAESWEPVKAGAYSHQLIQMKEENSNFPKVWIQYLCPWLAQKITPPSSALVERLPDGGLVMSATTETFDVNNPRHMAVATDIAAAMAPLNRLPWPSER